ncbi:hypothetical protein ACJRO7_007213 [Eucalyptus globulus]|uniref:Secreted protein n=1 Tax=Eucalyptus globulus TaxID=34317 RepID=A0ABD3IMU7_EUCGL
MSLCLPFFKGLSFFVSSAPAKFAAGDDATDPPFPRPSGNRDPIPSIPLDGLRSAIAAAAPPPPPLLARPSLETPSRSVAARDELGIRTPTRDAGSRSLFVRSFG